MTEPNDYNHEPQEVHRREVERLWRAVRRDYFSSLEIVAGIAAFEPDRLRRFERNWEKLCHLDINTAACLTHGFAEMNEMIQQKADGPNGPDERLSQWMSEMKGVAEIGRAANPDADVHTLGEIIELGEAAIEAEVERVDDELGELDKP